MNGLHFPVPLEDTKCSLGIHAVYSAWVIPRSVKVIRVSGVKKSLTA
jgi:hypothetical protein